MKAEIKFNLFVAKPLVQYVADEPRLFPQYLLSLEGVNLLQQYCLIYRAKRSTIAGQPAMNEALKKCSTGLNIVPGSVGEDELQTAIQEVSRVQIEVGLDTCNEVEFYARFFTPHCKSPVLHLKFVRVHEAWQKAEMISALWSAHKVPAKAPVSI